MWHYSQPTLLVSKKASSENLLEFTDILDLAKIPNQQFTIALNSAYEVDPAIALAQGKSTDILSKYVPSDVMHRYSIRHELVHSKEIPDTFDFKSSVASLLDEVLKSRGVLEKLLIPVSMLKAFGFPTFTDIVDTCGGDLLQTEPFRWWDSLYFDHLYRFQPQQFYHLDQVSLQFFQLN